MQQPKPLERARWMDDRAFTLHCMQQVYSALIEARYAMETGRVSEHLAQAMVWQAQGISCLKGEGRQ